MSLKKIITFIALVIILVVFFDKGPLMKSSPVVVPRLPVSAVKKFTTSSRVVHSSDVEIYMTNTQFVQLENDDFLESTPWEEWPQWVYTVLTNYAYSKKFGNKFSLWVPPPTEACGYWNRGWGNVLAGQYLTERISEGSYRSSDWLMYLDSDAFFNEPDVNLTQFLSTANLKRSFQSYVAGGVLPFGVARPLMNFSYIDSLADTSLIAACEHPVENVWELIDRLGYLNSGVFLLNMLNENTAELISEWSRSVATGSCDKKYRTQRIAEQSCLNSLCFSNPQTSKRFKHLIGIAEFSVLNSPAGRFVRHPWDVKTSGDELSWITYGWPLMSMAGISSKREALLLAKELLNRVMIRKLPMRFGDQSPAWEGSLQWPTIKKDVILAAALISKGGGPGKTGFTEYPSQQAVESWQDTRGEIFDSDTSESCLVVVVTASPKCALISWAPSERRCICLSESTESVYVIYTRNSLTWIRNDIDVLR